MPRPLTARAILLGILSAGAACSPNPSSLGAGPGTSLSGEDGSVGGGDGGHAADAGPERADAAPELDATAASDAALTDDAGAADDSGTKLPSFIACDFDPDQVYVIGYLGAGQTGALGIASVEANPKVCLAHATAYGRPSLRRDGSLIYLDRDNDVFRSLVPDELVWDASASAWSVPDAAANDTLLAGSCPLGTYPSSPFARPDADAFAYGCAANGGVGEQIHWSSTKGLGSVDHYARAVGKGGIAFAQHTAGDYEELLIGADGTPIPIQTGPSFSVSVRSHEDGFRMEGYHDLWEIAGDGSVMKLGNYSDYPADVGTTRSGGVLDGEGRTYGLAELKDGTRVIVRRSLKPGATEIVYSDANAPLGGSDLTLTPPTLFVHLDGARLFTGP